MLVLLILSVANVLTEYYVLILVATDGQKKLNLMIFTPIIKLLSTSINFPHLIDEMCCYFIKLKSVIFLKFNLEAILSNFIPIITVYVVIFE